LVVLLELPAPEVLLPEVPTLGLLLPDVLPELPRPVLLPLRAVSARSAATQSSNAVPVIPTQRERSAEDAEGPVPEAPDAEDELGDEGLVALGEVALPVEPGPVDPGAAVLGEAAPGLALEEPEALPELPACAKIAPLASAPAASTASAFNRKCFIDNLHELAARNAPMRKPGASAVPPNGRFRSNACARGRAPTVVRTPR
jgi:hypothetical protein